MNRVIKLSVAFLDADRAQKAPAHAGIRGRPPIGVSEGAWDPPFTGLKAD